MSGAAYVWGLPLGAVAGLRAFSAPALAVWAVRLGRLDLAGGFGSLFGNAAVRWGVTALAFAELVVDQLPSTPSRTVPVQFAGRVIMGTLSGAAIGASGASAGRGIREHRYLRKATLGAWAGFAGAILGTLAGSRVRAHLARVLHSDHRAALIEDAVAISSAVLVGIAL